MTNHPPLTPSARPSPPSAISPWQPVWEIIRFEFQDSLRARFSLVLFALFLVLGLVVIHVSASDVLFFPALRQAMDLNPRPGVLVPYANAPLRIMRVFTFLSPLFILLTAGIFSERATKDFTSNMDGLLFTSPLKEWQFAAGRLIASVVLMMVISLGLGLGLMMGEALPWMASAHLAPFNLLANIQPYTYLIVPNILIFGILSFAMGLLTRRSLAGYLVLVAVLFFQVVLEAVLSILRAGPFVRALLNPFGASQIEYAVQYWTKVEQNTLNVPFAAVIWLSRLLFLGLSVVFFAWVWRQFSFSGGASESRRAFDRLLDWADRRLIGSRASDPTTLAPESAFSPDSRSITQSAPDAQAHHGFSTQVHNLWRIAQLDLKRLIGKPLVLTIVTTSLISTGFLTVLMFANGGNLPMIPTTGLVVDGLSAVITVVAPLLIVFLAGDLLWREREVMIDPLTDSLPTRSWAFVAGKWLVLAVLLLLAMVLLTLGALLAQLLNGYTDYNLGVYGAGLFSITLLDLLLVAVLAITVQVLVNQKFLGYFVSAALTILFLAGDALPIFRNARFLHYGFKPKVYYSDISGYGAMLEPVRWFQGYWLAIGLLLFCLASLFWVRGVDSQPRQRWRIARQRFSRPMQMVMALSAAAALLLGGDIYYNTQVINSGTSIADAIPQLIAYERAYGHLRDAQPKIIAIDLQGDLYPDEDGRFAVKGTYTLENKTQAPVDTVLISVPEAVQINDLTLNEQLGEQQVQYPGLRVYAFPLPTPMEPAAILTARFDLLRTPPQGFDSNTRNFDDYLANGTSFLSTDFLPQVGLARMLVEKPQIREQAGLPPRDPTTEAARATRFSSNHPDTDLARFSAILSTASDQTIFTSGHLMRQWAEGNRRYFEYESTVPLAKMVPFVSGRYKVQRDEWQGIPVEVYYHPGHDRNVPHILAGAKQGLAYASQQFGPYPHQSLRIVETPYVSEAISYPGGQINMGEKLAFLTTIRGDDPAALNSAFRFAAHETAHQWWGHQVLISPAVPGSQLLTESLSEYTANQAYARQYGMSGLGIALRDNLNVYLQNRSRADVPLVEARQVDSHLVYQKGGLAMYALQDYLGEDVVNGALAQFLQDHAMVLPYPTATDFVAALRKVTPDKYQYLLNDLFESVTLYDNRLTAATFTPRPGGLFDVTLAIATAKVRSDNVGNETPAAINQEEIDVGVYDADGKLIYLKKHPFSGGSTELTISVDQRPAEAGIDPLHKLIDKVPADNRVAIRVAAG